MDLIVYIDGKASYKLPVKKSDTISYLKNLLNDYQNKRFFLNNKEELEVFNTNQYDNLKLSQVWDKLASPKIYIQEEKKEQIEQKEIKQVKNINEISTNLLTGIKDVDRLVLEYIDDKQLLEMCGLNRTYSQRVCDDAFFRRRTIARFPETVQYKDGAKTRTWKNHYLAIIKYIDLLQTDFQYEYTAEDKSPELLYLSMLVVKRNYYIYYSKNRALMSASEEGHLEIVKYLVENGADVTVEDNFPVRSASEDGHLSVVKYLTEHGADITATNNFAVIHASRNGHLPVVKYLVEHGADITAQDNQAVRYASENAHLPVVKYLRSLEL